MKKLMFSFVILFALMASINAQMIDTPITPSLSFNEVYQKALELNQDRFKDLNKIQIGDTVLFPAHSGSGVEAWVADFPSVSGTHDCIWRLTDKYLQGQLLTTPVKAPEKVAPVKESSSTSDVFWKSLISCLILLVLIALVLYYGYFKKPNINANPVLPGGLSDDASRARQQINGITAGLQIVKVERGRIFGTSTKKVSMHFSDGLRDVNLISGDNAYRVTQFDGLISYYRQHCGNLIAPVASGQFNLPDDWVFIPYTNEQSTWSAPEETEEKKPEVTTEEESPIEVFVHVVDDSILTGKDIATILEAAGKMGNLPSSISIGDLFIEFPSKKEE